MAPPALASAPPPHASVARSLASAAAALRAQEWGNVSSASAPVHNDRRAHDDVDEMSHQTPQYTHYAPRYSYEEQAAYDREAFYEELRERHRNLTHRQRIAREFYGQRLQHVATVERTNGYIEDVQEPAKRQRVVMDRSYGAPLHPPVESTGSRADASVVDRYSNLDEDGRVRTELRVRPIPMPTVSEYRKSPISSVRPEQEQTTPSIIEDVENEENVEDDEQKKKRVRYLRDTDRRNIIKRIENGEKQAALAREFGVTRAAICHIKKNRFEILSRYNMLVKSAQEMNRAENFAGPPGVDMMVHEVRANSVLLLMTVLRDNRTDGATFRRVTGRLIMILLEEALAVLGTEDVEVITGTGHLYRGLEMKHHFCGVAIGAEGFPFLVLFHQMEPDAPQGSIDVEAGTDKQGEKIWRLDHMDLPANIAQHKVLLFSATCKTGNAECKAIEALASVGCDESSISLVALLVASNGIVNISNNFPQVKIITGGIDGEVAPQTENIVPGFGDFVSRYNGA
ncbi:Uracil phosphoribosyltransferase [Phytophthora citrophthora]|uniref:Uracil phosphoribosyltransferase n=1 Tax=Phytophthora citrophthora TaxID=4793 RepID=A0AAD9GRE8_9STRA|nr:Uracil phosphoribosyltransferase [Phytophthora citrophthora]